MTQTNYLQIDVGATKQARAYQRKKEKKNTEEHKQFQQEAAIYLRVSSEMQKEGFSIEAQKLACQRSVRKRVIICQKHLLPRMKIGRHLEK